MSALARLIVRFRIALLALAGIATVLAVGPASRLTFNQSIESFYAPDHPHLLDYLESRAIFGGDEFVVVAFTDPELFMPDGTLSPKSSRQIRELSHKLSRVPGVHSESTQNLPDALTADRFPMLAHQREGLRRLCEGVLLGADRQATAVVLRLESLRDTKVERSQTIADIRRVAEEFPLRTYVAGEPVLVNDTFRYVEEDGAVLGWVSTGLLTLVIAVIFRNWRWILLPVVVVQVSVLWTRALLWLTGWELSMVSSMINSLLTVVGVATVIHFIVRFREHRLTQDPKSAAQQTFADLGHAVFWTTATTAAGFAAQITSHVNPVQSFGLMMACGTMLVFVAVLLILPGGMLLGPLERLSTRPHRMGSTARFLARLNHWRETRPAAVIAVTCVIGVLSAAGAFFLRVETDFSKNFRESSPIVQGVDFMETRLGGGSIWEISFPAPAELDSNYLEQVRRVARKLRALELNGRPQLTKVIAVTDGFDLVPLLPIPAKQLLLRQVQPEFEQSLYRPERQRMRIVLRAKERQRAEDRQQIIQDAVQTARQEFPTAKASGIFVLLTFLIDSLLEDQWVSLLTGAILIIGLMTMAFRSLRIGLISLFPNLLPILLVTGTMGWLGVPINLGTAMISSVSMGLTVDSSIHYFTGYFRCRKAGLDVVESIRETNQDVGAALFYTNLALIAGFLVLTLSHFMPLVYFGVLVSAAMLGGLIGNLLLLPLLIRAVRL